MLDDELCQSFKDLAPPGSGRRSPRADGTTGFGHRLIHEIGANHRDARLDPAG